MTVLVSDNFFNQLGFEIYPISDGPLSIVHPDRDDKLIKAFQNCNFSSAELLLNSYANANQKLFLSNELIEEIINTQIENILSEVTKMNRYEIIFDRGYSDTDKELLLKVKDSHLGLDVLSGAEKNELALGLLKKDFGPEFQRDCQVTLLWVAIFLDRIDLVRGLLFAKKPADPYTPFSITQLSSSQERYFFSIFSWYDYGEKYMSKHFSKILRCFQDIGIPKEYIIHPYDAEAVFLAIKTEDLDLLHLALDCGCEVNQTSHIDGSFLNDDSWLDEVDRENLKKLLPGVIVTPLSFAIYKQNKEMAKLLLDHGAKKTFQLSESMLKTLNELCPEDFLEIGELVKV